jgi:hypothetical protein
MVKAGGGERTVIPLRDVIIPVVDERSGIRGSMPERISEQCATCQHWTAGLSCQAFPAGIPAAILEGRHDHRRPFEGDRGIRYELAPRVKDPSASWP